MSAPSLSRLLSIYWDRHDLLTIAMNAADAAEGEPAKKKADAAQTRAGERCIEAVVAICAYVPAWKYEARLKQEFLTSYIRSAGTYLEPVAMDALLETVGKLTLPASEGGAS